MPLIPAFRGLMEVDLCEFKDTLGYMRLNLSKRETELTQRWSQHLGSHNFDPSPREVETGVIWLDGERNVRQKTRVQMQYEVL